jgi:hypothetical protein
MTRNQANEGGKKENTFTRRILVDSRPSSDLGFRYSVVTVLVTPPRRPA